MLIESLVLIFFFLILPLLFSVGMFFLGIQLVTGKIIVPVFYNLVYDLVEKIARRYVQSADIKQAKRTISLVLGVLCIFAAVLSLFVVAVMVFGIAI
jgi:hypothetical protein